LARVTDGEWEGCLALVTDEREATRGKFFIIYFVSDHPDDYRATDVLAEMDEQGGFGIGLDWLPPEEDLRLEAEFFGVRRHLREQKAYQALPGWRRLFRRKCRWAEWTTAT
jgi:hypothetical protein